MAENAAVAERLENSTLKETPLTASHLALGAKMAPFAGYSMPIQYADGIKKEHAWVREQAGIFDVSHMGQVILKGEGIGAQLSILTPSDFITLPVGKSKYTVLTNDKGGIIDDLIITRLGDESYFAVLNAGCKDKDIAHITEFLYGTQTLEHFTDRALIALQGPKAEAVLARLVAEDQQGVIQEMAFMTVRNVPLKSGIQAMISRSGYTGEDGYEISVPGERAAEFWDALLEQPEVKPIGLGARDSLRLEMGYPLYGHDLSDETSPVEAGLKWVIAKQPLEFNGHTVIKPQMEQGASRKRVGIKLTGKGIMREGMTVHATDGAEIGVLSSGGYGASVEASIGLAYVPMAYAKAETPVQVDIRGRKVEAVISSLPFYAPHTKKN